MSTGTAVATTERRRKTRPDLARRNSERGIGFDNQYLPEPNSGCWLWVGALTGSGYGHVFTGGKTTPAHRHSWQRLNGPIAGDAHVLHRCDTRCCVNPDHLFIGDNAANNADMMSKGRGRPCRGEANGNAVLSEENIKAIRCDVRPNTIIGAEYGVSNVLISRIKRRKAWSHVQ